MIFTSNRLDGNNNATAEASSNAANRRVNDVSVSIRKSIWLATQRWIFACVVIVAATIYTEAAPVNEACEASKERVLLAIWVRHQR